MVIASEPSVLSKLALRGPRAESSKCQEKCRSLMQSVKHR